MATGLDFSAGRPGGAAIKKAGFNFVIRYIGTPGRTKNITKAEFTDLVKNGVAVALVYENQAGDALNGYGAGQVSARAARKDADSIGFPKDRPIYLAVDRDIVTEIQFQAVMNYLRGASSVLGGASRTGVYGEYDVVMRARKEGITNYEWQTAAWSGGKHDANAELYQKVGYVYVGGIATDQNNQLKADYGQHPAPKGVSTQEDDDMTPEEFWNAKYPKDGTFTVPGDGTVKHFFSYIYQIQRRNADVAAQVAGLGGTINALSTLLAENTSDLKAEDVKKAVADAIKESVIKVDVTVAQGDLSVSPAQEDDAATADGS